MNYADGCQPMACGKRIQPNADEPMSAVAMGLHGASGSSRCCQPIAGVFVNPAKSS